jgi:hypothetical protein
MRLLIAAGVDGIMSDYPERLAAAVAKGERGATGASSSEAGPSAG